MLENRVNPEIDERSPRRNVDSPARDPYDAPAHVKPLSVIAVTLLCGGWQGCQCDDPECPPGQTYTLLRYESDNTLINEGPIPPADAISGAPANVKQATCYVG